jgi:two-component system LytT family sensor kinase
MKSKSVFTSRAFAFGIHLVFWLAWLLFPFLFMDNFHIDFKYFMRNGFLLALLAAFFYTNYFLLIPKCLLKKKVWVYLFLLLLSFIAVGVIFYLWGFVQELFGVRNPKFPMVNRLFFPFFSNLFVFALSSALRLTSEWFKNEKLRKEMENQKLTSELAFLKSQINPHFLFNTLNNICSLARKKSDDTENALLKLSQIMRYMLIESKDEKVPLKKEMEYLNCYIDLQRMRISDHVVMEVTVEGNPENRMIEPMLLIPFVENAFKHGVSYQEESNIQIKIILSANTLNLLVENTIAAKTNDLLPPTTGIGLNNVQRRLQLLYPGKHTLVLKDDGVSYKVNLLISMDV